MRAPRRMLVDRKVSRWFVMQRRREQSASWRDFQQREIGRRIQISDDDDCAIALPVLAQILVQRFRVGPDAPHQFFLQRDAPWKVFRSAICRAMPANSKLFEVAQHARENLRAVWAIADIHMEALNVDAVAYFGSCR